MQAYACLTEPRQYFLGRVLRLSCAVQQRPQQRLPSDPTLYIPQTNDF